MHPLSFFVGNLIFYNFNLKPFFDIIDIFGNVDETPHDVVIGWTMRLICEPQRRIFVDFSAAVYCRAMKLGLMACLYPTMVLSE